MIWLLAGCLSGSPQPADQGIVLSSPSLELGEAGRIEAAEATIQRDGAGVAQVVGAALKSGPDVPTLEIEAPRSSWDLKAQHVVFSGGVVAVRGPVELRADELSVWFASAERVERALAVGSVVVTRGDRSATGDRAELLAETGSLSLTGNPRLREGVNTMAGERIVLWLDDERVECELCTLVVAGSAIAPR